MQDTKYETENMNEEGAVNMEDGKKISKKALIFGGIGIVGAIVIIIAVVLGVKYLRSDAYLYHNMTTEKLPFVYTEEELRNLREGDECYLIVADMDAYETGYIGYLVDDKKHDSEAKIFLEIPIWAEWVIGDEVIAKARYVTRDRMELHEGEGKENYYRFELMETASLDEEHKICSDITQVKLVGRKTELAVGDTISVALIGSEHGTNITYKDDIYYVFNYLDVDYDYDELDEICKVQSDKKFIVASEEDVFHLDTSIDIDSIREMREKFLDGIVFPLVAAKVTDITPDDYYVLQPCAEPEREQYIIGVDTDKNTYMPIVEDDTNIDTFDEMIDWAEEEMEKEDGVRLDYRMLLFAEKDKILTYKEEMKDKLTGGEPEASGDEASEEDEMEVVSETEYTEEDADYAYFYVQYALGGGDYTLFQYDTYEAAVMNEEWIAEVPAIIEDYDLQEGTIIRCRQSDIDWSGDIVVISKVESMD